VPRRLDWGPGTHRGVYEISGDTLIFVFTTGGGHDEIRDLDGNRPLRWREVLKRLLYLERSSAKSHAPPLR
jgi:hypothetical protein